MDIAEFFKRGFENFHKEILDKNYKKKSLLSRKTSLLNARRETRDALRFNNRKIDVNMSPMTPQVSTTKPQPLLKNQNKVENNKRLEMLKQWKEKKNKQREEEKKIKKNKPMFKVFHVDHKLGLPDLENVNKEIKGKPIKRINSCTAVSFAPERHTFVAPKHIEPIQFFKSVKEKEQVTKSSKRITKPNSLSISQKINKAASTNAQKVFAKAAPVVNKVISDTTKILPRIGVGARIIKKVLPTTSNNFKALPPSKITRSSKNEKVSNLNKEKRCETINKNESVPLKINKSVGWGVVVNNKDSSAVEEKEGKKYLKTPRKLKNKPNESNISRSSKTPSKTKLNDVFESPNSQFFTPSNNRIPSPVTLSGETHATSPLKENTKDNISIITIEDSLNESKKRDSVIIYDDGEIILKTPLRKRLSSKPITISTPRYTPKLRTSSRKSRNDSCVFCPLSPDGCDQVKTPSTKAKTPSKKVKTPSSKAKTSNKKARTPRSENMEPVVLLNPEEIYENNGTLKKSAIPNSERKITRINDDSQTENLSPLLPIIENQTPVYISPFVTISRGKESARKEYQIRKSTGGTFIKTPEGKDFSDSTSPKAGAEYFENVLNNEIIRIEGICKAWETYKDENATAEETDDMINVAIGQSRLLISKKFEQFRKLIAQCKSSAYEEKPITCEDLHGFWDMIYQTVKDLNKRFDNLDRLKQNNWEEILPEKKVVQKRGRGRPKRKPTASSSLKDAIKAARNKKNQQDDFQVEILEPNSSDDRKRASSSSRLSLRVSLLRGPTMKRLSSPGLTMMKVTQSIKAGDGLTPSKSILKTDGSKSAAKSHKKSVLFIDHFDNSVCRKVGFSPENEENSSKSANLMDDSIAVRRSRRLSKSS